MRYHPTKLFVADLTQPEARLGTMEERCATCGHEYQEHNNGSCPLDDDSEVTNNN